MERRKEKGHSSKKQIWRTLEKRSRRENSETSRASDKLVERREITPERQLIEYFERAATRQKGSSCRGAETNDRQITGETEGLDATNFVKALERTAQTA